MICPYCNKEAKFCENKEVYGKNYGKSYMCYWCAPCNAYVGTHNNSEIPLGTMANKLLRKWRMNAHKYFDRTWKQGIFKNRSHAYSNLSKHFGRQIHIGESDIETCKQIIEYSAKYFNVPSTSK